MTLDPRLRATLEYLASIGWGEVYAASSRSAALELPAAPGPPAAAGPTPSRAHPASPSAGGSREPAAEIPTATPSPAAAAARELPAAERARLLGELAARAAECRACRLSEGRRTVVFGSGDPDAELMLIGEGPGAEEDRQGLPFVGPAGQLLDRIIQAIGLAREQVFIANVVKCRPPGNRDPEPDEVTACRGFLEDQVRLVAPRVIVALGRVAAQTLLGSDLPLGRLRGVWHRVLDVPVRVTYHPAALLRNAAYKRPTWEDMQVVRDTLAGG